MIGQRIKQARVAAALTQDEVVAALDALGHPLTKAGLSKYERGGSVPKPTTLRTLGKVLRVPADFFLEEPGATIEVEWLPSRGARLTNAAEERIKTLATAQVEAFVTLRRALEPKRVWPAFPRVKVPRAAGGAGDGAGDGGGGAVLNAAEDAARQLRRSWHVGDAPMGGVASTVGEAGGIVVETSGAGDVSGDVSDAEFDGMAGWVDGTTPVLALSATASDEERRASLARELGALCMGLAANNGGRDPRSTEPAITRFAAAFLVPAETARRELGDRRRRLDLRELAILKTKYGLGIEAWVHRATDLEIIDPAHSRSLIAELSARGWRKAEPVAFDAHERPLRLRQLTVRAHAEGLLDETQAERLCPGAMRERIYWSAAAGRSAMRRGSTRREATRRMDARELLKLPAAERDQLMARAAELVKPDYRKGGRLEGFDG